eukprot:5951582-Amphidinium_carterae.1
MGLIDLKLVSHVHMHLPRNCSRALAHRAGFIVRLCEQSSILVSVCADDHWEALGALVPHSCHGKVGSNALELVE